MSIGRVNHFLGPRGWAEVVDLPPCLSQKSRLVASATKPGTSAFVLVLCRFFTAKFGILTVAATDRPAICRFRITRGERWGSTNTAAENLSGWPGPRDRSHRCRRLHSLFFCVRHPVQSWLPQAAKAEYRTNFSQGLPFKDLGGALHSLSL